MPNPTFRKQKRMGTQYLLDSNVVIGFLDKVNKLFPLHK